MQAVDDILESLPLVLQVDHVGLREDRAAARDVGGFPALQAEGNEIREDGVDLLLGDIHAGGIDGGGESLGLLVDEGAGARRAGAVGVEVLQLPCRLSLASANALTDLKQGRILSPHADDALHIGAKVKGPEHLGDGFELIDPPQLLADLFCVVPRECNRPDPLRRKPPVEVLNEAEDLLLDFPQVAQIGGLVYDVLFLIDDHAVETDRSRVDPHVEFLIL
jgi:hypothetical protein